MNVVTNSFKDEIEGLSDAEIYTDDDQEDGVLDIEKMRVDSNKIFILWNGAF